MKGLRTLLAASLATLSLAVASLPVSAAQAPVHFADLNWESGSLITEVLRYIVEKGYDLPTDTLPGTTITLETALANNDIQVIGEEWAGRSPVWVKAEAEGRSGSLLAIIPGRSETWVTKPLLGARTTVLSNSNCALSSCACRSSVRA